MGIPSREEFRSFIEVVYADSIGPQLWASLDSKDRAETPARMDARWLQKARDALRARDEEHLKKVEEVWSGKATDFNDLHQSQGLKAVRECFETATQIQLGDNWTMPQPLPDALPAVEPFAPELLPEALRQWVMDIAHRMQCPADFPAVGAIVALSSLIGARAIIHPKERDDWRVVPNLWGACIARPGAKKSPALAEALKPLHRLQAREQELWQSQHGAWTLDAKVRDLAQAERERKAKGLAAKDAAAARALLQTDTDAEPEPVARRFIVNDATVEKLGELLKDNPPTTKEQSMTRTLPETNIAPPLTPPNAATQSRLQRFRNDNPRVDYYPSEEAEAAIKALHKLNAKHSVSSIIDFLIMRGCKPVSGNERR